MSGIRRRLEQLGRELADRDDLRVLRTTLREPARPADLERAVERWGGPLPDGMAELYAETDGFVLQWEAADRPGLHPRGDHGGSINLLPLAQVFGDWRGVVWFDDFEGGERFRGVLPFDRFVPEAAAALRLTAGDPPQDDVHYHYLGETLQPTGYSFAGYLDRLIESRGYYYWVRSLASTADDNVSVAAFLHDMPVLFPGFDASRFVPRPPA